MSDTPDELKRDSYERLEAELGQWKNASLELHAKNFELGKEITRLKLQIKEYGRHSEGCNAPFGHDCKCGFKSVLEKLV